ncbi:hypothetical protein GCM10023185_13690 [Hymenobacter saemangeumensis]|uniref:Fibronectin type-III domain-containing protein n=1 Tax=Hymenobacter saemangeumensis TaxID=1084522 RepID=A0ABP8I887_9BACT
MLQSLLRGTASGNGRRLALGSTLRALALAALAGVGLVSQSAAQSLATWPLEANNSAGTTAAGATAGPSTLADLVLASTNPYTALRGQQVSPVSDGSWTNPSLTPVRTRYEQFAVTAASGFNLNVTSISMNTGILGTSNGRLGVSYSTDPTFATPSEVTGSTLPSGTTSTSGSFGAPVALPSLSSSTGTSGTAAATTAFSFQLNGATGVAVNTGQTLYIRLYYNANTGTTTAKYVMLRNVSINGTAVASGATCADPTGATVSNITATSAQLSFTPGALNTSYTVTYYPTATPASTTTVSPAPTASPVNLTGLSASTDYTVTLRSNCSGNGASGSVITNTFTTPAPPVCADPTNVSIANRTATSADLVFTAGSLNTSYTVTITPQGGPTTTITPAPTASPVSFTGLSSGTQYTVTLRSNCSGNGGVGTLITRTFVAPVANSPLLQEWPLTANNTDDAGTRATGVSASTQALQGLAVSNGTTVPTVPAYAAATGQAFAPTADGGSWGNTQVLSGNFYTEFTVNATSTYTVRVDSITFATGILQSSGGRLAVRYSTNGFSTSSEPNGWVLPAGASTTTNSGFTTAFTGLRNVAVSGAALTAADTYRFALNGVSGVTLQPGQTLTVRLYYAVGTSNTGRYALLRDVMAKGQATFTMPTCNDPSSVSVGAISYNSARLSFTAGSGNSSYVVTLTPQGGSATTISPAPTASPVNLTGLTAGTTYTVTLQANCAAAGMQSSVISRTFSTPVLPLQHWPLRVSTADSAALRSVAVTASSASLRRLVASNVTTPDDFTARFGHAFAPTAAGGGWNSTGTSGGAPSRGYYIQFTVTAASGYSARIDSLVFNSTTYGTAAGRLALAYSRSGFTQDSVELSAASFASPITLTQQSTASSTTTNNVRYRLPLNGASGLTITPGQTLTVRFYYGVNSSGTSGRYALLRDVFATGAGIVTTVNNITVSSAQIISGNYNNVTITGTGTATLGGSTTVAGTLTVQSGGSLVTACQPLGGSGSFVLASGATLSVCDASGISGSGASGAVQTGGSRSFSPDANYIYNGSSAQVTGSGLPATVRSITVNNASDVTLSQALSVSQLARLQNGDLNTNGQAFVLLSAPSGTAVLVNTGGVVNGTGTMQRAITNSVTGPAYRHLSSPVQSTTFADLSTPGFTPVVNPAYNSSATPNFVTPFPTVFGYDESRIATATSTYSSFDKGWFSPSALTDVMQPTRGYTVNAPATATPIDFVGTFNNGTQNSGSLSRGTDADAGWHLLGNPYPAPLDWSTVTAAQRPGMDAAMYVYQSTGRYVGNYRSFVNGMGTSPIINAGAGYFVRVSAAGTPGAVNLTNANRVTSFAAEPAFGRGTTDTRAQLQLQVSGANLSDDVIVYFDATASATVDAATDAVKLANPAGLNLAALAGTAELAINGLAPLAGTEVIVPLALRTPQAGAFAFEAAALANFGTGTVYLRDAQTGTQLLLSAGSRYAFTLAGTSTTRFSLVFRGASVTAAQSAMLAGKVSVYPNPAAGRFAVLLPPVAGQQHVQATLLNALGQVVASRTIALTAAGASSEFDTQALAAGVYVLRLQAGADVLTQRVVVE